MKNYFSDIFMLPHLTLGSVENFQFPLSNTYLSELGQYMGFSIFEAWKKNIFNFVSVSEGFY